MIIASNDIIECDAWKKLSNCHYAGGKLPPKGLVHCEVKHLYEFLKRCGQEKGAGPYVLVTSDEDYGLVYQERHPVWKDVLKYVAMRHFRDKLGVDSTTSDSYDDVIIPARCDVRHCDINHKFSFKTYAHTELTFDELPSNISHWFAANNAIEEDFVTTLPLGVQRGQAETLGTISRAKKGLLYINFSLYTKPRLDAFNYFCMKEYEWATVVTEQNKDAAEFLEDIAAHEFVLCPQGNGMDTYRLWQTLYLGSIPIVNSTMQESFFSELPIMWCGDLDAIQSGPLGSAKELAPKLPVSFEKARLSYWKGQIADKVREALEGA
tara:strand:- start:25 stop:990 length:966 start_codon:yes stop_codon:yes gene_type:complete